MGNRKRKLKYKEIERVGNLTQNEKTKRSSNARRRGEREREK